jgi:predicted transposase YdaD
LRHYLKERKKDRKKKKGRKEGRKEGRKKGGREGPKLPNLMKYMNSHIQDAQCTPGRMYPKKFTSRHIIIK